MAIMLRKMPREELGFDAENISAVGYATPPCVSKELAENCSEFVTTIVMQVRTTKITSFLDQVLLRLLSSWNLQHFRQFQDDIIPRLSTASLARLRNEILQTDW